MGSSKYISVNFDEYVSESVESDIKSNKEAKRVYNKIKRNIQEVKLEPTHNDFITDSKGNRHPLNGVKFNLTEIGEKYDLEILLANSIKGANPHYSSSENRIVFFIISQTGDPHNFELNSHFARLRFSTWVDEIVFIHEFIHFLDNNRYGNTYSYSDAQSLTSYYNSPEEYNAHTQEIITHILKNKAKFAKLPFQMFLKKAVGLGGEFVAKLDADYTRKLEKRLYKLHTELNKMSEKAYKK